MEKTQSLTRRELYDLVWATPMHRLCADFGLSDRGLAKICERFSVPRPPRGYWAKLEAGRKVSKTPLPQVSDNPEKKIDIRPAPPAPAPSEAEIRANEIVKDIGAVSIPENLRGLHPVVAKWVNDHAEDQAERRRERRGSRDGWYYRTLRADLTERDKHRFRVTSAFLRALEAAGGAVESGELRGKLKLKASGEIVECAIVEKMKRKLLASQDEKSWTAWPEHHNSGLTSSGYLRFKTTSWGLPGKDLVESDQQSAEILIARFVGVVMAAGPLLRQRRIDREEQEARWREERAARAEQERLARIDEARWAQFRQFAKDWEECVRIRAFMAALAARATNEQTADGKTIAEWLLWAETKIEKLDPLSRPAARLGVVP